MSVTLHTGDCRTLLPTLPAASVHCVVTSPPYWGLRDYGTATWDGGDAACDHKAGSDYGEKSDTNRGAIRGGPFKERCGKCGARRIDQQLGLEATPEAYVANMVAVFRDVRRVLRDDGVMFVNMGDAFTDKQLVGMPWRLAFALQADGWFLRADIIWAKPNPMPESVTDRPTKAHEYVFLLSKAARYFYDADAVREPHTGPPVEHFGTVRSIESRELPAQVRGSIVTARPREYNPAGRNLRSVWSIPSAPFSGWTKSIRRVHVASDAADDDTKRITSPDCPVHGDRLGPVASVGCDARGDDFESRTERSGSDPAPVQSIATAATDPLHDDCSADESSGCLPLGNASPAISRSMGSRKTGRAPATTRPCTPSEETPSDTPRSAARPASADSADHSAASNSGLDDSAGHPSVQIVDRSGDIASCRCTYYHEITENTSHFATFPPALAARCIQAGTSAKGCCRACGAPWTRTVDAAAGHSWNDHADDLAHGSGGSPGNGRARKQAWIESLRTPRAVTWAAPTCPCPPTPPIPCTVLDPFAGSGTVGEVAEALGRHSILLELSPSYTQMAKDRTAQLGLFAQGTP